jgi:signal peptidase complex subunit 1
MKRILKKIDPCIDFVGQELACRLLYVVFIVGYTLAFIVGLALRDLRYTLFISMGTVITVLLAVVPPWPCYRKNPRVFQPAKKKGD